ncbi:MULTISPECIES: FecR family protein [Hyphomonas]|uniref:Iron dicitrate transport regulator FecR n=1 Tax=Hyphomonas adhaerens TaxID=81029 RepID=A0A3B9GXE7_9PROT|nr:MULTISPECIES: FecR domain-containing protein [Hyphomonas]MBB41597.1 hypothetical protein [Hyphomonas sp.]HAE27068.1 hypothetical protein [Hyphomonas adhaerens]
MTHNKKQTRHDDASLAEQAAAGWLMILAERRLTDDEAAAFDAWMKAAPENEETFRRQESAWRNLPHLGGVAGVEEFLKPSLYECAANAAYELRLQIAGALAGHGRLTGAFAAAMLVCAVGIAVLLRPGAAPDDDRQPLFTTQVAELRNLKLDDGSEVTLGAASALDVSFSPSERRVFLARGEAYFEVAKDPSRPFIVATPDAVVRVVGTKFDVKLGAESVRVAVSQGRVEVLQPVDEAAPLKDEDVKHVLLAGQSVVAGRKNKTQPVLPVDAADVAAWRDGMLVYVDAPLRDIIVDLNRYSRIPVELADPAMGDIQFTAAFNTAAPESMRSMINTALGLKEVNAGDRIILEPLQRSDG